MSTEAAGASPANGASQVVQAMGCHFPSSPLVPWLLGFNVGNYGLSIPLPPKGSVGIVWLIGSSTCLSIHPPPIAMTPFQTFPYCPFKVLWPKLVSAWSVCGSPVDVWAPGSLRPVNPKQLVSTKIVGINIENVGFQWPWADVDD